MTRPEPTVCFVIPTRDRPDELAATLDVVGTLDVDAHMLVIDNGSDVSPLVPGELRNGIPVDLECLPFNEGAGARNRVIGRTNADWIVMLDDDSYPVDDRFVDALAGADADTWVVSADVRLPNAGTREMGGLPEVFVGCGVAIRRERFEQLGGYDASFGYYAEEYDFSARVLVAGGRVAFDPRFRVDHMKSAANRDMNTIVQRLVRNNGWVMQRYAPACERREQLREARRRCRSIATREDALPGYRFGLNELRETLHAQLRRPMTQGQFDRFTGLAAAREAICAAYSERPFESAAIVHEGKNAWCVHRAAEELGVEIMPENKAQTLLIGTMSPGPMLDAAESLANETEKRFIVPWSIAGVPDASPALSGAS